MAIEDAVIKRLEQLLTELHALRVGNKFGQVRSEEHRQGCAGWLASAEHLVKLLCPNPDDGYRVRVEKITSQGADYTAHNSVGEVAAILNGLLTDARHGLLASIADRTRAETFDDFLDHAEAYYEEGRKNESGVIAGVVFEDALRRICRKHTIDEKGSQLDEIISALAKKNVLSATKAKRARSAAHVRTKATHAQWDDFDIKDVKAAIDFTREIVEAELDA